MIRPPVGCRRWLGGELRLLRRQSPVSEVTEMSTCSQEPFARSANGLPAEFSFPTLPESGGSNPDGRSSPVERRQARQPSEVFSRTGRTSAPAKRDARPFRRRNAGKARARIRAMRAFVSRFVDSTLILNSRRTVRDCPPDSRRETTILSALIVSFQIATRVY